MTRIFNVCLLLGFLFVVAPIWGESLPVENARLTVSVYDDAHLSGKMLAAAERAAAAVFRRAGLEVVWVNCELPEATPDAEPCNFSRSSLHLEVRVRPGSNYVDSAFGHAFLAADGSGEHSVVFYDRIQQLNFDQQVNRNCLLGHVIAHEMGHLLLGLNAHSRTGIMEARWAGAELRSASMGQLLFTREQAQLMRARAIAANAGSEPRPSMPSRPAIAESEFRIRNQ